MVELIPDLCFRCFTNSGQTSVEVRWRSNSGDFIATMEGTAFNISKIFWRRDGVLRLPRPELYILDGKKPLDLMCILTRELQIVQHSVEIYSASE